MGSRAGRAGVSPWSDLPVSERAEVPPRSALPLNRILYIPFSIFAYSSNMVIASFVRMGSKLAEGTSKNSRFFLSSASFRDRAPVTKLTWLTTQPGRCMALASADRSDSNSVWSFVPRPILSDLFVRNPLLPTYRFRMG
jgi:hypothetical protein